MRSNGARTPGTIVYGYAMLFDTYYEVRLDDSQLKPAVPEEDLFELHDGSTE